MATVETAGAGAPLERFGHVIAGAEVFPAGGPTFVSVNPTTGKAWAEFPSVTPKRSRRRSPRRPQRSRIRAGPACPRRAVGGY